MFEERYWGDEDPVTGEPMPFSDEPELTEQDYLAEVERQIAADPQNRPEPSAAEVIARAESDPMTPGLIEALHAIDASTVAEDLRVGLTVGWDRAANYCTAQRALAAAAAVAA